MHQVLVIFITVNCHSSVSLSHVFFNCWECQYQRSDGRASRKLNRNSLVYVCVSVLCVFVRIAVCELVFLMLLSWYLIFVCAQLLALFILFKYLVTFKERSFLSGKKSKGCPAGRKCSFYVRVPVKAFSRNRSVYSMQSGNCSEGSKVHISCKVVEVTV